MLPLCRNTMNNEMTINTHKTKTLLTLLLCFLCLPLCAKKEVKTLSEYLDHCIKNKQQFTAHKQEHINSLKRLLANADFSAEHEYEINFKLYEEYKKFRLDSAIYYVERNYQLARKIGKPRMIYTSAIDLSDLYSCRAMYRECEHILKSIDKSKLPPELLRNYYDAYRRFFERYSTSSQQRKYNEQSKMYMDSLLSVLDPGSFTYRINFVHKLLGIGEVAKAEEILIDLLQTEEADTPNYALITHYLGSVNRRNGNPELERKYYTLSAIADIKNSIKENASFRNLAQICYETGDLAGAFKYTQSAIEDAVFCNVQFRTTEMSEFYSIINASYQEQQAKTKSQLLLYLILISILSVFLILLVFYVYKQMKKLSRVKEQLSETNNKLTKLNDALNNSNEQLSEANHIKQQYIAQFFDICSTYINKMEDYRKSLNKLALNNQYERLNKILRSTTMVDYEVEELYKNFDTIFLSLYPTFVSDFNSLLEKDEQISLKSGDLLNRELRIYALLRLGITDSVKIAGFLRCSLSTVYNYRSKMRNKAAISRDEFEDIVMKIGVIDLKHT